MVRLQVCSRMTKRHVEIRLRGRHRNRRFIPIVRSLQGKDLKWERYYAKGALVAGSIARYRCRAQAIDFEGITSQADRVSSFEEAWNNKLCFKLEGKLLAVNQ